MGILQRIGRHARLTALASGAPEASPTPPFVTFYMNSVCNQTCEHCYYWRNLNRRDDLTFPEIEALSGDLGRVENLNLSGGEPFLRKEFGAICRMFIRNNHVRQIYVPTNGSFADRTVNAVEEVLKEETLQLFVVELSLDGMPEFHNRFRGMADAFERSMATYRALVEVQARDQRLRIHATSTAAAGNIDELLQLTRLLYEQCPRMDHHTIGLLRGERKNASLEGPDLERYRLLCGYVRDLWAPREQGRFGGVVEPMLQWTKVRTAVEQRQVVRCTAGKLSAVIYANGDVSVCETRKPFANIRQRPFSEIWRSPEAIAVRQSIAARECWCTGEIAMWPSIVFQPWELGSAWVQSKAWRKGDPVRALQDPAAGSPFRVLP